MRKSGPHACPLADAVSTARSSGQYIMPVICLAVGSSSFITLPFFRFTTCRAGQTMHANTHTPHGAILGVTRVRGPPPIKPHQSLLLASCRMRVWATDCEAAQTMVLPSVSPSISFRPRASRQAADTLAPSQMRCPS